MEKKEVLETGKLTPIDEMQYVPYNPKPAGLLQAMVIATKGFENKVDKGGQPYILHCYRVMQAMPDDDELKTIAMLHDCIEDGVCSLRYLVEQGFSERVIQALVLLTHDKQYSYDAYINQVSQNIDAIVVKLADLKDNMDITRLPELTDKDIERLKKYHRSYLFLSKVC